MIRPRPAPSPRPAPAGARRSGGSTPLAPPPIRRGRIREGRPAPAARVSGLRRAGGLGVARRAGPLRPIRHAGDTRCA